MRKRDSRWTCTAPCAIFGGMPTEKQSTSFRLSDDARRLLAALADALGLSQAAVIEMAVRQLAKREGVK
jgi:hypothetical protein